MGFGQGTYKADQVVDRGVIECIRHVPQTPPVDGHTHRRHALLSAPLNGRLVEIVEVGFVASREVHAPPSATSLCAAATRSPSS